MADLLQPDATIVRGASQPAPAPVPQAGTAREPVDLDAVMRAAPGAMQDNVLVRAAAPLLLLAVQLRHSARAPDVGGVREGCVAHLRRFEDQVRQHGVETKTAMVARYVLCTMVDEAVLASPWGEGTGWSQRTLLAIFHGETYGGAKVFELLDRLARDPARNLDLLELIYLVTALGFGGRYLVEPGGQARLADRQAELFALIRRQRAETAAELSPHWRGVQARAQARSGLSPLLIATLVSVCLLLMTYLFLYTRLNALNAPINAQLARIGLDRVPLPSQPRTRPRTLEGILIPEQRAGLLTITIGADASSTIRLSSAAMFGSGSEQVNPAQYDLLARIASELNRVPGRVMVLGHTDDQPIKSPRFKDNFALSQQRAQNVAAVLGQGLSDPRRMEVTGAGDSQPIALPPGDPANRARNRRVEIVLIPEA